MIIPRVNLNGDRRETLITELNVVRVKLDEAIEALEESSYANGRNYQLNPTGDGALAQADHSQRIKVLQRVYRELGELQYEISLQGEHS